MARFLARNIAKFILLMLAVSLVTFVLVSVSPIDPVQANVGQTAYINMSEAKRAQLAEYWGVNTPLWERYANWFVDLLHGDLGTSLRFNAPVIDVIATRAVNSLALMATAWAVSGVLGLRVGHPRGREPRPSDRPHREGVLLPVGFGAHVLAGAAVSHRVLGAAGVVPVRLLGAHRGVGGRCDLCRRAASSGAAALTLSVIGVANIALHTREKTIDVLESDYVRFAVRAG